MAIARKLVAIAVAAQTRLGAVGLLAWRSIDQLRTTSAANDDVVELADTQHLIAAAVEEQTATTPEMGRTAVDAAALTEHIARNAEQVDHAVRNTSAGATETDAAARSLDQLANDLRALVGTFRF